MKTLLKLKDIKIGTKIIVFGDRYVKASQIASCYGLSGYPHLILINENNLDKLRGLNRSDCVELGEMENYPQIANFYK